MINHESKIPLISVIMPTYNSARFICESIISVLNQSYQNLELIIVDDNSTDDTLSVIKKFKDKRIKLFKNNINCGVSFSRNFAINIASGKYCAFIDSDDIWIETKIEKQLEFSIRTNSPFTFSTLCFINEDSKILFCPNIKYKDKYDYKDLLRDTVIPTSSVMLDLSYFKKIEFTDLRSGQDYALWLTLLKKVNYAYCLRENLLYYRKRRNSLSSNKLKNFIKIYNIQLNFEKIRKINVIINIIFYIINSIKKHYLVK